MGRTHSRSALSERFLGMIVLKIIEMIQQNDSWAAKRRSKDVFKQRTAIRIFKKTP